MSYNHVRWTHSLDDLTLVTWDFWVYDTNLVLDSYTVEKRQTTRHGYKTEAAYNRLPSGAILMSKKLTEAEVPLTDEVREEALAKFIATLRVVRWSEVSSR